MKGCWNLSFDKIPFIMSREIFLWFVFFEKMEAFGFFRLRLQRAGLGEI